MKDAYDVIKQVEEVEASLRQDHSEVHIVRGDEEIVYSMEPIEKLSKMLDDGKVDTVAELELIRGMNEHQLRHLASILVQKCHSSNRLVNFLHTKKGQKMVEDIQALRELAKKSGETLWPELDEMEKADEDFRDGLDRS